MESNLAQVKTKICKPSPTANNLKVARHQAIEEVLNEIDILQRFEGSPSKGNQNCVTLNEEAVLRIVAG